MSSGLSDEQIQEALQTCADEQVHVPGTVQPFACVIGVSKDTGAIRYAIESVDEFLGGSADALLGLEARDVLGRDIWQHVRHAAVDLSAPGEVRRVGQHRIASKLLDIRVFDTGELFVVEIEPVGTTDLGGDEALNTLTSLLGGIQDCESEQRLFDMSLEVLQALTGYGLCISF